MKWFHRTETLETRLFKSIVSGNKEGVRTMLGEGPDLNLTFYVVEWKDKVRLAKPSEIEKFQTGTTSLDWCDGHGNISQRTPTEMTNRLLDVKKDAVYKDILEALVTFGYPAPKGYLSEDLAKAVQSNNITAVETLIRKKADINEGWSNHDPPIIEAVKNGYLPIIKLLVENGAKMEVRSRSYEKKVSIKPKAPLDFIIVGALEQTYIIGGYTPLMLAVELKNSELATYLIDNGA